MNRRPAREVIAEALQDAWLTSGPARPADPGDVADRVQAYLDYSGYAITPRLRRRAPRRSRTATAVLAFCWLDGVLGAAAHASHGQWFDTAGSAVLTFLAAIALVRDHNPNRRNTR